MQKSPQGVHDASFIVACCHWKRSACHGKQSVGQSASESLNAFGVVAERGGARDVDALCRQRPTRGGPSQ